jgi:uncharacterized protein YodC (DUF2158 family)
MKKGQKKLRELGMEEEFASWKESVGKRSTSFQVGSRVRIKEGTTRYRFTGPGSIGVITCAEGHGTDLVDVQFKHIIGAHPYDGDQGKHPVFPISRETLELIR